MRNQGGAAISTQARGHRGEDLAAAALVRAGYRIVDRNWRCPQGELDLIARHRDEIVFVEVRARADDLDAALESIGARKQARLAALVESYLAAHGLQDAAFRIDVAVVNYRTGAVEVIENAVGW